MPNKTVSEVKLIAQQYGADAITTLVDIMQKSETDTARISAAKELLDRGYGKATQPLTGAGDSPLIPAVIQFVREPD